MTVNRVWWCEIHRSASGDKTFCHKSVAQAIAAKPTQQDGLRPEQCSFTEVQLAPVDARIVEGDAAERIARALFKEKFDDDPGDWHLDLEHRRHYMQRAAELLEALAPVSDPEADR